MWKLSLYILYAASLFAMVSSAEEMSCLSFPLNTCILTVQSTAGTAEDPRTIIDYGILNRFAISNPPVNPLTVADGGTSGVFEELGNGLYSVGFSVESKEYEMQELRNIVTQQWTNTTLFKWDVGGAVNWKIVSANC